MSEENKLITFVIGTRTTGKTAITEAIAKKWSKATGKKVNVFKRPTNDSITSNMPVPSDSRTMPPELFKVLQTEQYNVVGRPKWWEIHLWFKIFKKA